MDANEKIVRRLSKKEKQSLERILTELLQGENEALDIKKLKGSHFFRIKKGRFRIIFHYDSKRNIIVDAIRLRQEDTYKDF